MLSTRSAVVALSGIAALLAGMTTASATPLAGSAQTARSGPTAGSARHAESASAIQYNPGDSNPEYGPNSFVITMTNCAIAYYVEYRWERETGRIRGDCNKVVVESIAPSGGTEYPLQWRQCTLRWGKKPPLPFYVCAPTYREDVVRTS